MCALTRRLSILEEKYARQNAEGDGTEDTWEGWWDYGSSAGAAWHNYDVDNPTPHEANWAERAAKAAGGKGKVKGGGKGKEKAKAKPPPNATAKANPNKIRISTFKGERVKITDLKEAVLAYLAGVNQTIQVNGSVFGNNYTVVFGGTAEEGAACVQATNKGRKFEGGAGYRKVYCKSAIEGNAPVQLFFNPDKNAVQQAAEYHFRVFKRAVRATHNDESFLVDPRDKMFSLAWRPIVQLLPVRGTGDYKVLFHNPAALEIFSPEQQSTVVAAYRTAIDNDRLHG